MRADRRRRGWSNGGDDGGQLATSTAPTPQTPLPVVDSGYLAGTGNKYTLWYFDPARNTWLIEGESIFTGGLPVLFDLRHFSAHAITR